jgi:hypothetical protein
MSITKTEKIVIGGIVVGIAVFIFSWCTLVSQVKNAGGLRNMYKLLMDGPQEVVKP